MKYLLSFRKIDRTIVKIFMLLHIILWLFSCTENPTEQKEKPCPPINAISMAPYNSPIWHPSSNFIGFNFTPLDSITHSFGEYCVGLQYFNLDSKGFWLINTDGTNQHRILPFLLQTPSWSPDGNWVAFVSNAQIYKMPFSITEQKFDTTQIEQLTFERRNFYPSWSNDGKYISYSQSICDGDSTCGVHIMKADGTERYFIEDYAQFPTWIPNEIKILYKTSTINDFGEHIGDSLFFYDLSSSKKDFFVSFEDSINLDNRYFRFSPNSVQMSFLSKSMGELPQLWIMELVNNSYKKLTYKGVADDIFSWSPNGDKIVYVQHDYKKWNYDNGVLWIIDIKSKNEYKLTFNVPK